VRIVSISNRVLIWSLGIIAELLLVYDALLVNMQSYAGFTGCNVGSGADLYSCAPVFPPLLLTVPTGGLLFSDGLLVLLLAILIGLPAWILAPKLARRRGASARMALLITSLPASVSAALALVCVLVRYPVLAATETCFWAQQAPGQVAADPACNYGGAAQLFAIVSVAFLPLLATCLFTVPAWVMGLAETDHQQRWGWYFAVLYLSPIAATLYGLFGGHARLPAPTPAAATGGMKERDDSD
jgi:hypothetical protein